MHRLGCPCPVPREASVAGRGAVVLLPLTHPPDKGSMPGSSTDLHTSSPPTPTPPSSSTRPYTRG